MLLLPMKQSNGHLEIYANDAFGKACYVFSPISRRLLHYH